MATVLSLQNELAEEKRKTKHVYKLYFQLLREKLLRENAQHVSFATSESRIADSNRASVKAPEHGSSDAKRLAKKRAANRKRRARRQTAAAAQAKTSFVMKPSVLGEAEPVPSTKPEHQPEHLFASFVGGGIALSPIVVINAWHRQKCRQTVHMVHRGLLQ